MLARAHFAGIHYSSAIVKWVCSYGHTHRLLTFRFILAYNSLVFKDLVYEAKAKAETFFSRPRPRTWKFFKAKARAKPRLFSQGQGHKKFSRPTETVTITS